ncbi:MAG: hypothetical protein JXR70_05830 [Spirochaetales bacterium]|nr:hypothetical protein [Spirochaetales bacterium]
MLKIAGMFILLLSISPITWSRGGNESFQDYIPLTIKEKAGPQWLSEYEMQLKTLSLESMTSSYALLLTRDLLALEEDFPTNPKEAARVFHRIANESDLMIKKGESSIKTSIISHSNWTKTKNSLKNIIHSWGKASPDFVFAQLSDASTRGFAYSLPGLAEKFPDIAKKIKEKNQNAEKAEASIGNKSDKTLDKALKTEIKSDKKDTKTTTKDEKKDNKESAKEQKKDDKKVKEK